MPKLLITQKMQAVRLLHSALVRVVEGKNMKRCLADTITPYNP